MDIEAINQAIAQLEISIATLDSVAELANLYIVRDHMKQNAEQSHELKIFPCYSTYIERKRQYQMQQIDEVPVADSMKDVCQDLDGFFALLYSNSDTRKERKYIKECIEGLYEKYCK